MASNPKRGKQSLGGSKSSDQQDQEATNTPTKRKPLSEQERAQIRFLLRALVIIVSMVIASALITGLVVTFIL